MGTPASTGVSCVCRRSCRRIRGSADRVTSLVDMGAARQDRRDQRAHLAAGTRPAHPATQTHRRVHERFESEPDHQRCRQDQTRGRDQQLVVEGHVQPIDRALYCTHSKCPPESCGRSGVRHHFSALKRLLVAPVPRLAEREHPRSDGTSLRQRASRDAQRHVASRTPPMDELTGH